MKKRIGFLSLLLLAIGAYGQEKETVHSVIVEWHEMDWYKTQQGLWKKEVEANKLNGEAWINYYSAVRALRISTSSDEKLSASYLELGRQIVKDAYAAIPESFEANYMMYCDAGLGMNDESFLLKAYRLNPSDPRVLLDMLIHTEVNRDKKTFSEIATKLYQINRMPEGALTWAYNSLTEIGQNGIVFTAGDNDTYAFWIVQEAMNYRKDVMVINTSMIQLPEYQEALFKEKGINPYTASGKEDDASLLFRHIFNNKAGLPVHVSGSAIGQFEDTADINNLYLTGLTYIYSTKNVENIAIIKRNFEKRFLLDHLTKNFTYSLGDLNVRIKHFYLPGLIKMYQHYKTADDLDEVAYYKGLIDSISKELNIEAEVQKALED